MEDEIHDKVHFDQERLFSSIGGLLHGNHETSTSSNLSFYYTPNGDESALILVLLQGWPQTYAQCFYNDDYHEITRVPM